MKRPILTLSPCPLPILKTFQNFQKRTQYNYKMDPLWLHHFLLIRSTLSPECSIILCKIDAHLMSIMMMEPKVSKLGPGLVRLMRAHLFSAETALRRQSSKCIQKTFKCCLGIGKLLSYVTGVRSLHQLTLTGISGHGKLVNDAHTSLYK